MPCLSGSPTNKLSTASQASQGTGSPIPKIHGSSFVTSTVKVILLLHYYTLPVSKDSKFKLSKNLSRIFKLVRILKTIYSRLPYLTLDLFLV